MKLNPLRQQLPVHSPLTLRAVLASLAPGDPSAEVEAELSRTFGVPGVVLTDSGTSALALALLVALERRPGGYCLLPGFGCYDLATAALAAGARVMLYDIEPTALAPRLETLLAAITEECAAIVIVDHFGIPPALDEIMPRAARTGVMVVEDAAQSAGSSWCGIRIGNRTDAAVLSFGRGKGVTAGRGGALLLGADLAKHVVSIPLRARPESVVFTLKLVAQYLLARPAVYAVPAKLPLLRLGDTVFRAPSTPARIASAASRVLSHSIRGMDESSDVRRLNADRLRAVQAQRAPDAAVVLDGRAAPGWLRLPHLRGAMDDSERTRAKRLGIMPSYPQPLTALQPLRSSLVHSAELPGAIELSHRLWTLPTHGRLSERDLAELERWIERSGS